MSDLLKPDPFAPGFTAHHTLDHRPEIARAVGELCSEWALMELRMFALFATLTDAPLKVSRAIFYEMNSTRARTQMLEAVARAVIPDEEECTKLSNLLAKINKSARKRNGYVHDAWALPVTDDGAAAQMRLSGDAPSGTLEQIDLMDLCQLAGQIRQWADQLVRWVRAIDPALPAWHERLRRQPALALALKRRGKRQVPL